MATELNTTAAEQATPYVEFWNEILVPKFVRFKHVLVGGLTHHSDKVFPSLEVKEGDRAVDVGCGFGDTAMQLANLVGSARLCSWARLLRRLSRIRPNGCCGRRAQECRLHRRRCADLSVQARFRLLLLALRHAVLRESGRGSAQHADVAQTGRHHDDDRVANVGRQPLACDGKEDRAAPSAAAGRRREDAAAQARSRWPIRRW